MYFVQHAEELGRLIIEKIRKRSRCEEVPSKKVYLFSPVYEVELVSE